MATSEKKLPLMSTTLEAPCWFFETETNGPGVLFLPRDPVVESVKPKHWIFVSDGSGSMQNKVQNSDQSLWDVAVKLMEETLKNLLKKGRTHDVVTLLIFNNQVRVVFERRPVSDFEMIELLPIRTQLNLGNITPNGSTDLGTANIMAYLIAKSDPLAVKGERDIVELFFTDGEPTQGLTTSAQLKNQKVKFYQDLEKVTGQVPFLWCGALSTFANWNLVRDLSQASPARGLWVHIRDEAMSDFATEMGGALAAALYARSVTLLVPIDVASTTYEEQKHWLLQDSLGFLYCSRQPRDLPSESQMQCSELVELHRIQHDLTEGTSLDQCFASDRLEQMQQKLQELQNPTHKIFLQNRDLLFQFETTRATLLANVEELLTTQDIFHMPCLTRQQSGFRQSSLTSNTAKALQSKFKTTFSNLMGRDDNLSPISCWVPVPDAVHDSDMKASRLLPPPLVSSHRVAATRSRSPSPIRRGPGLFSTVSAMRYPRPYH